MNTLLFNFIVNLLTPIFPSLSDPARSTRLSLDTVKLDRECVRDLLSTYRVKMQCERDECSLRACSDMQRFSSPWK